MNYKFLNFLVFWYFFWIQYYDAQTSWIRHLKKKIIRDCKLFYLNASFNDDNYDYLIITQWFPDCDNLTI